MVTIKEGSTDQMFEEQRKFHKVNEIIQKYEAKKQNLDSYSSEKFRKNTDTCLKKYLHTLLQQWAYHLQVFME